MKIKNIIPGVVHVDFDCHIELSMTFLRFQEYYESPEYRNKIFTLGEFKEWYSTDRGSFSYCDDWGGFNVPSHILDVFRVGLFDPLTDLEKKLLEAIPARRKPFYVIGTYKGGDDNVLEHELRHGLYYTDLIYSTAVDLILAEVSDKLGPLKEYLAKLGYHEATIHDECHAYIGVDHKYLKEHKVDFPDVIKQLQEVRDQAMERIKND